MVAKVTMREVPGGWNEILTNSQGGVARFTRQKCQELIDEAIRIFESQAKRTKPPTSPQYVNAFLIKHIGKQFYIINNDPVANLIEFGAHPGGGETFTLRYRPLGRALEVLALDSNVTITELRRG